MHSRRQGPDTGTCEHGSKPLGFVKSAGGGVLHKLSDQQVPKNKYVHKTKKKKTPWLVVRKRTIPTEQPPLVSEVSANFCESRVLRGQRNGSPRPLISVFKTGAATFSFK
jgi:hypothetical protein